jgi:hypothetical protein
MVRPALGPLRLQQGLEVLVGAGFQHAGIVGRPSPPIGSLGDSGGL